VPDAPTYDVLIVGGGPSGLSAALVLGRMRRDVLVCDTDAPANSVSHGVGGLLTRDGTPPAELRSIARDELGKYPSVTVRAAEVTELSTAEGGFEARVSGEPVRARKVLLAHGLDYDRPEIPGVEELWGERAFHCPFCHGWEARDRRVAVIATMPKAGHQALLLGTLSDTVTVVGDAELEDPGDDVLAQAGIERIKSPVELVFREGDAVRLELTDGEPHECDAIFIQPDLRLASGLAESLGAELTSPSAIECDATGETSVPGLYAAGDAAGSPPQSVAVAIGSGSRTGAMIHAALSYEDATG
jgi:thioredoxin reductase